MLRTIYVGFVVDLDKIRTPDERKTISIAKNKRKAGELMELWIQVNDPKELDYKYGGVYTISDKDFINLE